MRKYIILLSLFLATVSYGQVVPPFGVGDISSVWSDSTGDVSALTAASGDSLDATLADSTIPWRVNATAAPTTEGQAIWDSTNDILTIGDGAATDYVAQGASDGAALTGDSATAFFDAGILEVARGGTGVAALTDGFVILGSGTAAVTPLDVTTDGGIIIGDGTTDPVVLDVGSSAGITILGTIATGVWQGTAIADAYVPNNITIDLATTVTTNANLTGDVTSTGNATDITESVLEDGGTDELAITAGMMNAGTAADNTTYWRGDNTWVTPSGSVEDDAFAAGWNADTTNAPSQNAVYDYLVNFDADADGDFTDEGWFPGGGVSAWDDIADPDNAGLTTITFDNAELSLLTGDNDAAASFLTIQNTDADHTGGNLYLLDLDYSADDGDADADFIRFQDSGGVVMTIQQDGEIATDGGLTAGGTVEGATITEGGNAVWNATETDIIDSAHYIAASIDNEHLADNAVDSDELTAGSVDQAHFAVDVIGVDEMEDVDHGMVSWSGGAATVEDFAMNADADAGDFDIDSLDRLEFFDAGLFVDGGTDGVMDITSDGTLELHSADWDISTTGVMTGIGDITTDGDILVGGGNIETGDIPLVVGDATTDSIQLLTDSTGDAEVALPTGSISGTEILDDTIDSDDYAAGSIDQEHFAVDVIGADEYADGDLGDTSFSGGASTVESMTVVNATTGTYYIGMYDTDTGANLQVYTDGAFSYAQATSTVTAGEFAGGGGSLTGVDAATGDSATAYFDAGTIEHEYGGLQADISGYTGLIAITGADTTAEIDALDELEGQLADVTLIYTEAIIPAAGTDPDVDAAGEFSIDTDGANETDDVVLRTWDGTRQVALAGASKQLIIPIVSPDSLNVWTGRVNPSQPIWFNDSGMSFVIEKVYAISDDDNYDFTLFESASATDMSDDNDASIIAIECDADGTECYTDEETGIAHTVEHDHAIIFEDTLGSSDGLIIVIKGYFASDVD